MATVKTILYTRYKSKDGTYPIIIRLIDRTKQKLHPVGYKVKEGQFKNGQVIKHEDAAIINSVIDVELGKAKRYFADCKIKGVAPDITLAFAGVKSHSFVAYLKKRAEQYDAKGQVIMRDKAKRAAKELECFWGRDVFFSDITPDKLRDFDVYIKQQGARSANTRAKKFDFFGRWYGSAVKEGLVTGPNHFKEYHIQTEPVKKEKLTRKQFADLEGLQLKDGAVRLARDMFCFSYYCKGVRFETVVTMPKSAVANNRLYFQTNKGKQHLSVTLHSKLKAIVDHYINNDTPYIFPVLKQPIEELLRDADGYRSAIGSANTIANRNLKIAASLAGIRHPLNMHQSRHSFAFHLKQVSDNIHVIKDSLGHSKSDITERYLKELDDEFLDSQLEKLYGK